MIQTSLAKRIALIAAGGLMSCLFAAVASSAAEIKVVQCRDCKEIPHRNSREWPGGSARTTLDTPSNHTSRHPPILTERHRLPA